MTKKRSGSSAQGKRPAKNARHMSDSKIDFSDIPELSDAELESTRKVGRPKSGSAKQLIAVRIAPDLLTDLRKLAKRRKKPYQTLMHELLEKAVSEVV